MAKETATKTTKAASPARVEMRKTELIPILSIALSHLEPQKRRREYFKPQDITELADSIKQHGLINPITVRPNGKGYELVAGERRLLATKKAGYDTIEAIVRNLTDQATIEIQLVENLKRLDLPPLDEALSYKYLIEHAEIEEGGAKRPYTVSDIAAKFARTEEIILRRLKLTDLSDEGRKDLVDGFLPLAHAELLARFPLNTQERLLKENVYRYGKGGKREDGPVQFRNLQQSITANNISRGLTSSKFNREDPSLHKEGLVCSACPERTGYSPKLFNDTKLASSDSCLNPSCWDSKLWAMLTQKREKLATELPNPKNLPLKELVQIVPMVKGPEIWRGEHCPITIGKGVYLANNYRKQTYNEAKKGSCPNAEKALRVGGNDIGSTTLICRAKDCKVHNLKKESSSGAYDYEADRLKRQEHELNEGINDAVRIPLITKKVEQYNEKKWVFDDQPGRVDLLVSLIENDAYHLLSDFEKIVPADLIKNRYQAKDVTAILAKQKPAVISQIFAVVCFGSAGESDDRNLGDQAPVKEIAKEFGENYEMLAAEARVKLTPTEGGHRAAAQAHLEAIKAGKKSNPPTVFWPRKKVEPAKKASAKDKKQKT